jgi:hypothetical protein
MSGRLDDVRIYNRALSATEVEQLYEGRFTDTTGLVGHWKMDEGTDGTCAGGLDVCDHSGNENHGDNVGATWQTGTAPTRTTTASGYAATFDGVDDYVEVPYSTNLDGFTALSISQWIYPTAWPDGSYRHIIDKDWASNGGFFIGFHTDGDSIHFYTANDNGAWRHAYSEAITQLNTWYHVVGVWEENDKIKIYINTVKGVDESTPVGALTNAEPITIARDSNDFSGKIDDVRIYNRALSEDEVKYLYETTKH